MKFKMSRKASMTIAYAVSLTIIEPMNMYTIFFSRMARSQSSWGVVTDFRNLMSVTTPQLDWDRAIRLKKIVYMFMGSMIVKETAYAIVMLALRDILNFIGLVYASEATNTPIRF